MGFSRAKERANIAFTGVFQHHTEIQKLQELRNAIIDSIYRCITSRMAINDFPVPYYGSYNVRPTTSDAVRNCLDELLWKRSELTGKYIGCPYWSVSAKALFDAELATLRKSVTLEDAWKIARGLQKRGVTERRSQLTHEHVFPRKTLVEMLAKQGGTTTPEEVEVLIERFAIGCVILESEHPRTPDSTSIRKFLENPWLRYSETGIKLVENPAWPPKHQQMIKDAGLV